MDSYTNLYNYIPAAPTELSPQQLQVRQDILEFKEGVCPEKVITDVAAAVRKAVGEGRANCTVCFVPAASQELTVSRYADMAQTLGAEFADMVYLNTIGLSDNYDELLEETRTFVCNSERINGKKVIFIDSIYNTGASYRKIVSLLKENGAADEYGIYIVKVIRQQI